MKAMPFLRSAPFRLRLAGLFLLFPLCLSQAAGDTAWHQFRGPGAMGVAENTALPETWSPTENVAWKSEIPGRGWSCPVVSGGRIFLTTAVSTTEEEPVKDGLYFGGERPAPTATHEWRVICLDLASGRPLWEKTVHRGVPAQARHLKNSYASETPVTDGERVFAYFGNVGMFAFDLEGKPLWDRKWNEVKTRYGWGSAASPVLHRERIYLLNDNEDQSFLIALDRKTGEVVWKTDREEGSNWSPPFVWENGLRSEIVTTGSGKVRSYDLEGKLLWSLTGLSSITVTSPFAADGLLYFGSGYVGDKKKPLFAIRPGASGDISLMEEQTGNEFIAWCQKTAAPYMPTPVLYQGRLYVLLDRGMFSAFDAKTGRQIYDRERLGGAAQFTASPLAWNGKIFCFSERGQTSVVVAGDTFRLLRQNELGERIMATPAIAGDSLLIRTDGHLWCLRKGASLAP